MWKKIFMVALQTFRVEQREREREREERYRNVKKIKRIIERVSVSEREIKRGMLRQRQLM